MYLKFLIVALIALIQIELVPAQHPPYNPWYQPRRSIREADIEDPIQQQQYPNLYGNEEESGRQGHRDYQNEMGGSLRVKRFREDKRRIDTQEQPWRTNSF